MEAKQKIINFISIVIVAYFLYTLNKNMNSIHQEHQNYIHIMRSIGQGQSISDNMIADIVALSTEKSVITEQQTPLCFIKAFYQIVIKQSIEPQNLFKIFEDSKFQFNNIQKCSHYYSLLLYRSQLINQNTRPKVNGILEKLQRDLILSNDHNSKQNAQICVYFNGFNNQLKIKDQIKSLANQNFKNSLVLVQDDGSADNTPIFAKYIIEELKQKNIQNVVFSQNSKRRGVFNGLSDFLKRCNQNSIVIVLSNNDTLLSSNVFTLINQVFQEQTTKIAILGAITSPHFNIHHAQNFNELKNYANPIVAFKKQKLQEFGKLSELSSSFVGLEKSLLAYYLASRSEQQKIRIKYVNEACVYRQQQRGPQVIEKIEQLEKQFSKI